MSAKAARDMRLDFFRGLALITIFVNHVPGNVLEHLTSRNFGFSDAAEAFVLMSGIAAGLAYSRGLLSGEFLRTSIKVWSRAFKLYAVHIAITLAAILILMSGLHFFDEMRVLKNVNGGAILKDPVSSIIGVFTLGHQLGYFNILPLYMVVIATTPAFVWLASIHRGLLLGISVALWAIAGAWGLNLPNWPTQGGWFLNPLSWQLVYVIGLLAGMSTKKGEKLVPFHWVPFACALGYLAYSAFIVRSGLWNLAVYSSLPDFMGGFNKSYLALQRLVHILCLAYVLTNIGFSSKVASSAIAAPINYLGRHSLPVFASGSIVCITLQVLKSVYPMSVSLDLVLLSSGLAFQYAVAAAGSVKLPLFTSPSVKA